MKFTQSFKDLQGNESIRHFYGVHDLICFNCLQTYYWVEVDYKCKNCLGTTFLPLPFTEIL